MVSKDHAYRKIKSSVDFEKLVDMRNGIITKTAATPADKSDGKAFIEGELCPDQGMVFLDKGNIIMQQTVLNFKLEYSKNV